MKILIYSAPAEAARRAADAVIGQITEKPDSVLGLATGGTMEPVYELLAQDCAEKRVSFAKAVSFNLDEYAGLAADHPCSFRRFMDERLFSKTDFADENTFVPDAAAADPAAEAARYESLLAERGPVDLQLLGVGANGHIGFNEPTSSLGSRTRVKTLTARTREANKRFFPGGAEAPKYAVTMGIQNILEARRIVLLASGPEKAAAAAAMIEGPLGAHCPATALQLHAAVTVILDKAAASGLNLREYYEQIHPGGREAEIA